jgi:hypothetical protein
MAKRKRSSPKPSPEGAARYFIAVVPKVGVDRCLAGGFAMFAHGRHDAIMRTKAGDWLAYYSPRTVLKGGEEVRAFTAIGKFTAREPYEAETMPERVAWRRDIKFEKKARAADVYPLLDELIFIKDREHWGLFFHRSLFTVQRDDFAKIAAAMGLDPKRL